QAVSGTPATSINPAITAATPVGVYKDTYRIDSTSGMSSDFGYTFASANGILTINQRPITVTADAQSKVYGNADPTLTYKVTSGNLVNGDTFSGTLARAPGENVGTYAITQGTLANPNYAITYIGNTLTITKRTITITAGSGSKTYGNADPV